MGKILAISNQKGGVGKTTTCVNLSAYLAYLGKQVLVIDFDPQGNATSGLGFSIDESTPTIYNTLVLGDSLESSIFETAYKNLFIAPSDINLSGAEVELVNIHDCQYVLQKLLNQVKNRFDYIFIDCPPSLGLLTVNALVVADSILIPLQCEYFAMEGMSQLLKTIEQIKKSLNPNLVIEGIIPTMFDGRNNISKIVLEELKAHFKDYVYNAVITRNVKLSEAPSFGQPIFYYDDKSKGAETYSALAGEFLKNNM